MAQIKPGISLQTTTGEPMNIGDVTITPQAQAIVIRWPAGGFVWNRPAAIRVKFGEQERRIPIIDVTRIAQAAMLGLSVIFTIVASIFFVRQRSQ